jgi:hypothetical protein
MKTISNIYSRPSARCTLRLALILSVCWMTGFGFWQSSVAAEVYAIVSVEEPVSPWSEPDLTAKLLDRLSGYRNVEFDVVPDSSWKTSVSGSDYVSSDYLARVGAEYRARYVIVVENLEETLETRKGLSIPLILSRYSQVAVLTGTLRVVDTEKGRMVLQKDFETTFKSRSRWELFEDDANLVGLITASSERQGLFSKLEWRAAGELATDILKVMKLK